MEELKEICCTEAERTQGLRADEFSRDELRESQSSMNQLTVQIQELQVTVNFLNDSRDSKDLVTASSSGSFHVPGHPLIVQSFFGKPRRYCSPQLNTPELCTMPGNL